MTENFIKVNDGVFLNTRYIVFFKEDNITGGTRLHLQSGEVVSIDCVFSVFVKKMTEKGDSLDFLRRIEGHS